MIWCGGCPTANTSQCGGFSVYCCVETAIMYRDDQDIQEGHGTIWSGVFSSELSTLIYGINMLQKAAFMC